MQKLVYQEEVLYPDIVEVLGSHGSIMNNSWWIQLIHLITE